MAKVSPYRALTISRTHLEVATKYWTLGAAQAMLDQRDFTGKAALHHAVADMEARHSVVQALLAAKAQVT